MKYNLHYRCAHLGTLYKDNRPTSSWEAHSDTITGSDCSVCGQYIQEPVQVDRMGTRVSDTELDWSIFYLVSYFTVAACLCIWLLLELMP